MSLIPVVGFTKIEISEPAQNSQTKFARLFGPQIALFSRSLVNYSCAHFITPVGQRLSNQKKSSIFLRLGTQQKTAPASNETDAAHRRDRAEPVCIRDREQIQ